LVKKAPLSTFIDRGAISPQSLRSSTKTKASLIFWIFLADFQVKFKGPYALMPIWTFEFDLKISSKEPENQQKLRFSTASEILFKDKKKNIS